MIFKELIQLFRIYCVYYNSWFNKPNLLLSFFLVSGPFLLPSYQLGSQPSTAMFHSEENGSKGMDPLVLIDAIAICMAYEEKELCKIGEVALAVIFDVASIILGSKERVRPLWRHLMNLTSFWQIDQRI